MNFLKNLQHQAISLLIVGGLLLALQDAMVKFLSESTSFWQFQILRSLGNIIILALIPVFMGFQFSILRPRNFWMVTLRTAILLLCMVCFFSAAPTLTFAQMATGLYTYPIFVVIFSFVFLKEKLTRLKLTALFFGICGATLVIKPWATDFSFLLLLPIFAGFFYACNIIILRKFCFLESPFAMNASAAIGFFLSGIIGVIVVDGFIQNHTFEKLMPFIAVGWPKLTLLVFAFAFLASILNLSGNLCLVRAYQTSEGSWLAPLDFMYLVFALFWGKVIFNNFPDYLSLLGIIFILLSGATVALQSLKLVKN